MPPVHLGLPIWGNRDWVGTLFTPDARPADFLGQYAGAFDAVEGNTTFYGVPGPDTVARWAEQTPPTFSFCFKAPRAITHERRLCAAEEETAAFLGALAPLGERLGPFLLQLPPTFGPPRLEDLDAFLAAHPVAAGWAVEVRHSGFFDGAGGEAALVDLLSRHGADRAVFDTRSVRGHNAPDDAASLAAARRKPDLPVRFVACGRRPLVRYLAHMDEERNDALWAPWVDAIATWVAEGRTPYFFVHLPDDRLAPQFARRFRRLLGERIDLGAPPPWPGEVMEAAKQLDLFGDAADEADSAARFP